MRTERDAEWLICALRLDTSWMILRRLSPYEDLYDGATECPHVALRTGSLGERGHDDAVAVRYVDFITWIEANIGRYPVEPHRLFGGFALDVADRLRLALIARPATAGRLLDGIRIPEPSGIAAARRARLSKSRTHDVVRRSHLLLGQLMKVYARMERPDNDEHFWFEDVENQFTDYDALPRSVPLAVFRYGAALDYSAADAASLGVTALVTLAALHGVRDLARPPRRGSA